MTPRVNREALSISTEAEPGLACADPFTLHDASMVRHVRCIAAKVKASTERLSGSHSVARSPQVHPIFTRSGATRPKVSSHLDLDNAPDTLTNIPAARENGRKYRGMISLWLGTYSVTQRVARFLRRPR